MRALTVFAVLLAPGLAAAGTVRLSTSDGVTISATTWGRGDKGVVLVHDDGRSAADWSTFGAKLGTHGFHVVAVDLRGHGATGGTLSEADYPRMVNDVTAAAAWLTRQGADEVMVVGAGLGANLALNAAAATDHIDGVAMLTPAIHVKGVKVSAALDALGDRPLLLVADGADALANKAASLLAAKVAGPTDLKLYGGAGAGVRMLNGAPELEGVLLGWLNGSWKRPAASAPTRQLEAGRVSDVEATGTKLEDRRR